MYLELKSVGRLGREHLSLTTSKNGRGHIKDPAVLHLDFINQKSAYQPTTILGADLAASPVGCITPCQRPAAITP